MFIQPKPLARKRPVGVGLVLSLNCSHFDYVCRSLNLVWITLTSLFCFNLNPVHIAVSEKWRPRLILVGLVVSSRCISIEGIALKVSHCHRQNLHLPPLSIIITGFDSLLHFSLSFFFFQIITIFITQFSPYFTNLTFFIKNSRMISPSALFIAALLASPLVAAHGKIAVVTGTLYYLFLSDTI